MTLLTVNNPKITKGLAKGYLTAVLHLSPASKSGYNVCPGSTAGCRAVCLDESGHGGMFKDGKWETNVVQVARRRKTIMFFENRSGFLADLVKEVKATIKRAEKLQLIPAFRLNATSDVRWETIPVTVDDVTYPNIMTAFPNIQFYDYTKLANRRNLPANYHLTFSLGESNESQAIDAVNNGMNVAVVFRKALPPDHTLEFGPRMIHCKVINGDETDLRFLDPKGGRGGTGIIVGLKAKGKAKKDTSGFVHN